MSKKFHAVEWMRYAREALDRENRGKPLKVMLENAYEKVSQDPAWKDLLKNASKGIPARGLVKGV